MNKTLRILEEHSNVQIFRENGMQNVLLSDFDIEVDEGNIYFEQRMGKTFDINLYFKNLKKGVTEILNEYGINHKWLKNGGLRICKK